MSLSNIRILLLVLLALEAALLVFGPQSTPVAKDQWWADSIIGIRYAAWINLGLLTLLLGTSKWWASAVPKSQITNHKSQITNPKWFWPLVMFAMLTCLGLRLPLASKSLWWDESWVMLQAAHGKWRPDTKQPGQLKFQAHDWKRCAFYYQKPTNHVPMSLAQKASLNVWRKLTGAKREEFSDLAARAPALLGSCAAVLLLGLLLRSWDWPGAGVAAAFVLALHPWHTRYGVDARAYALVVPLCIGGMFAVSRIWQFRGTAILPWLGWGLVEFLWLWAYPNAVLDVAVLNLVLAIALWRDKDARAAGLFRLVATNLFAAMAFMQMFLPNVMQALHWAGGENVSQPVTLDLIKSTLSHLILGVEFSWACSVETEGLISSATGIQGTSFALTIGVLAAAIALLLFTRSRTVEKLALRHWIVLGAPVISSILFAALVGFTGSYFYQRFIIAALPCVIALACMLFAEAFSGKGGSAGPTGRGKLYSRRSLVLLLLVILGANIGTFWFAQTRLLMTRPYAPLRDVADYAGNHGREMIKDGRIGWPIFVCYGHGHEVMPLYLPEVQSALSRADLEKFIAQARNDKRPLLVLQGHSVHNRALIPDGFSLLDDPTIFRELKSFAGIEPEFYFRMFRLIAP